MMNTTYKKAEVGKFFVYKGEDGNKGRFKILTVLALELGWISQSPSGGEDDKAARFLVHYAKRRVTGIRTNLPKRTHGTSTWQPVGEEGEDYRQLQLPSIHFSRYMTNMIDAEIWYNDESFVGFIPKDMYFDFNGGSAIQYDPELKTAWWRDIPHRED